ncbi:hypothetical protein [Streptosporangium sp. NPDC006930]|uniref:hypothetical protein n=1 Tax=unclassified Streptosporangium TaxID=2632669 RepID=UPI003424500A
MHHFHGYTWTGQAAPYLNGEGIRRPFHPEFRSSPLPPMRLCDWLLKPRNRIVISFDQANDAATWLVDQYDIACPSFHLPDQEAKIGRAHRHLGATEVLPGGTDIQWGFHLKGERFVSIGVICCPNKHAPDYKCPAGQ